MNPLESIGSIFGFFGNLFNWITGRSTLNNSPEMQAREKAKKDTADDDEIDRIIRDRNTEEIKKRGGG